MFYSMAYKEWLKLKYFFIGAFALGFATIGLILVDLQAIIKFNKANAVWDYIIVKKFLFYGNFEYIPIFIGLMFAVAQFVPEVINKRLKLTLHLPIKEDVIFMNMIAYGTALLTSLYAVFTLLLVIVSSIFFPMEFTSSMLQTIIPWMIAGYSIYFFTTFVIVEPNWIRRVLLVVFGYFFISQLLINIGYSSYNHSIFWFVLICAAHSLLVFVSGFRFKRGAK